MTQPSRIQFLNDREILNRPCVLYWMQAAARTRCNHALEYAIAKANELKKPLRVYFGITDRYPSANERHYDFMLEGLREVARALRERGISFVVELTSPEVGIVKFARDAALVVTDRGYTRIQREWRNTVAEKLSCPLAQVETDVVIPVETVSLKREFAARTIRPKIHRLLSEYLVPLRENKIHKRSEGLQKSPGNLDPIDAILRRLKLDRSVRRAPGIRGGMIEARKKLRSFVKNGLSRYDKDRNDPNLSGLSQMSPYLHFGQISPLEIALEIRAAGGPGSEAYLEELIVRRELSMNFAYYAPDYDRYSCLPNWVKQTLERHRKDPRPHTYTLRQLEKAETHDPYWNAAEREMAETGKMHGYMRMYWGKKILEWSRTPEEAYGAAISLNDKYELDGRDPNGYAGVAWCFGNHDRPWQERPIFGMVRYMNAEGLKRKFDADCYARIEF